ncbi:hypothetical protein WJX74_010274 [Apatococcus lobatus]|uniref:SREBP regulating gene protein n=1 Tax=Apatococcus lobatus TaxID=904363 RepID=A0AAW1RGI0_9CHLO
MGHCSSGNVALSDQNIDAAIEIRAGLLVRIWAHAQRSSVTAPNKIQRMIFQAYRITLLVACLLPGLASAAQEHRARLPASSRRIHRDLKPEPYCNNTVQGRAAVTDDQGFYCTRDNLNSQTGCCLKGQQYSCETCSSYNLCCEEYERCVSCCLSPSYRAKDLLKSQSRSSNLKNKPHAQLRTQHLNKLQDSMVHQGGQPMDLELADQAHFGLAESARNSHLYLNSAHADHSAAVIECFG